MIDYGLDFSDLLDLSSELASLSKAESRGVLRNATRAAAGVIRDEVEARAPEQTGKLKRNIVVVTKRDRDGGISSGVHIRSGKNRPFYWRFLELGTSKMAPVPFIRPAYDVKQEEAVQVAFDAANRAIDEALSR